MAHPQDDRYRLHNANQPPYSSPYQQAPQTMPGAEATPPSATAPNFGMQTSGRPQTDELFFGQAQHPPPPPRPMSFAAPPSQRYQYSPPTPSQGYNPQAFAGRPVSVIAGQQYGATPSPSSASPHAAYNPADYHSDNLNRVGSVRSQSAYTAGYGTSSPVTSAYSPHSQQAPSFPSPPAPQPPHAPQQTYGRMSLYGPPMARPTIQTSSFHSEHGAPPPPPRTQSYGLHPPPLSTIPGSATEAAEGWNDIPGAIPSQTATVSPPPAPSYIRPGSDSYLSQHSQPSPPAHGRTRSSFSQSSHQNSYHSVSSNVEPPAPPYTTSAHHPLPPTPSAPPPPMHDPQRSQSQRSRTHADYFTGRASSYDRNQESEGLTSDALMADIEHGLTARDSPSIHVDSTYTSDRPSPYSQHSANGSQTNGHLTPDRAYEEYGDSSDLEAEAGIEAMRIAEEEDAAEARRLSGEGGVGRYGSVSHGQGRPPEYGDSQEESDGPTMDLSQFAGGFDAHMSYGGAPEQLTIERQSSQSHGDGRSHPTSSREGSTRRSNASDAERYEYGDNIHPFPPFATAARVDTGGTGGLQDPSMHARRLSYDEGDETGFLDEGGADMQDLYFHPGMTNRPLPPPPAAEPHYGAEGYNDGRVPFPISTSSQWAPQGYIPASANQPGVPRSTSLLSHGTPLQASPLPRSRTDAEERERKRWLEKQQGRKSAYLDPTAGTPPSAGAVAAVALDLPALPDAKRYSPSKLGTKDYIRCAEPWALSGLVDWLKLMTEGEQDLREQGLVDGLVQLFKAKVPTMNIADAEMLATTLIAQMREANVLIQEEEWLKFGPATMTGVVVQLTGSGCYSPKLHVYDTTGRCYSHHCQRTLKKLDLSSQSALKTTDDWHSFYGMKKEDTEGRDQKEVERQNILHEIVQKEDKYMDDLDVLRLLYRDSLQNANPPLITPSRLPAFIRDVFGKADAVKKANEDHLLPWLKYRQKEQGPWIVGFSDIFREWIREARSAYIAYAAAFPNANFRIRKEAEKNMLFRNFLDQTQSNPLSNRLAWDTYLKVPITKLQQYGLLLETVLRRSTVDNEEKKNLMRAITEIREVTHECDIRVAQMSRKVNLKDLQNKLKLRPGMEKVELNLDHLGRELIFEGDLQRSGSNRFAWLDTHALLFDHYLVLAKTIQDRDEFGVKMDKYDVSRLPIPMDLLVLESRDDGPVVRSKTGIAAVSVANNPGLSKENGPTLPGQLQHTNTSTSLASLTSSSSNRASITQGPLNVPGDDRAIFPFKIKHLGKETYTLYAPSAQNREEWCDKILEAKKRHAASLFQQNAEPFRLRVMADCAFFYDASGPAQGRSIVIQGTPLDRAIQEVEARYRTTGRPMPACRARVNCATSFTQPDGKAMYAIGTDFGVYVSAVDDPRGWSRVIPTNRVTQIAVLEEFSLFLLIADKSLVAYHLDVVCGVGGTSNNISASGTRGAPQKLSGSRDVGFFNTGRMKDRQLVFFKKRDGLSSTFKILQVLEPVLQKSTEKKSRFHLRSGRTEFFREYDEFYIPTECMGLNVFHTSLAVCSSKGFEVLTLDKKQSWSVPDLKQSSVATIAQRLQGQQPLGMFRLSDLDFLCVYEECAVYVNKHGEISRSVIMEFVGRARQAALYGAYVLLFDSEFLEIRNTHNGRLRQVISGRDIRCLDDGLNGTSAQANVGTDVKSTTRRVKIAMQHPSQEKIQLVAELSLNEGMTE